ncbi:AI-2E family transporter [Glaciecola sp. KUL10]|uniref:AI-2E family transporter n=1 Tax=Glaciecola sp. (strain KUL10) TaxID=2161813 RepID=UPI000D78C7C8|nr:AI-2E family transporter [Glaciecola sp. KUL10]GBL04489.1 transport protein [Glaciecola sp. KUL10]
MSEATNKYTYQRHRPEQIVLYQLGAVTAMSLYLVRMPDPLLWGVLVAMLNFIPYVGMMIGMCVLALAATVEFGFTLNILIPLACYAGLNLLDTHFLN